MIKTIYRKYIKTCYAPPVWKCAQVQGLKESRLTIRWGKGQGLVSSEEAGDAESSRASGLTSGLQGSVNVHRGALLLVPQWLCISSYVLYIREDLDKSRHLVSTALLVRVQCFRKDQYKSVEGPSTTPSCIILSMITGSYFSSSTAFDYCQALRDKICFAFDPP